MLHNEKDPDCPCVACQQRRLTAWANHGAFAMEDGEYPRPICGAIARRGLDGAPLACAYEPGHTRYHSWAGIPRLAHNGRGDVVAVEQAPDMPY